MPNGGRSSCAISALARLTSSGAPVIVIDVPDTAVRTRGICAVTARATSCGRRCDTLTASLDTGCDTGGGVGASMLATSVLICARSGGVALTSIVPRDSTVIFAAG